jgi:hypothetical protein
MKKLWAIPVLCLAAGAFVSVNSASAQDRAWGDCTRRAAVASGVQESAILVGVDEDAPRGGTYILNWEVRGNDPRRQRGYCEIDRHNKSIVRFETNPYKRENNWGNWDREEAAYTGEYPRVKVDTDGKGYFASRTLRLDRLDRGYVDLKEQPSVTLRGRNGMQVTFYGVVISSDGRREITLRIMGSDRGDARGRVQIRLNPDRNEVEWISLNGYSDGGDIKAEFNRNR